MNIHQVMNFISPGQSSHHIHATSVSSSYPCHLSLLIISMPPQSSHHIHATPVFSSYPCHPSLLIISMPPQSSHHIHATAVFSSYPCHLSLVIISMPPQSSHHIHATLAGLDIGYVPAGPHAFFRSSGQFGPQQFILCWPAGPVAFRSVENACTSFFC